MIVEVADLGSWGAVALLAEYDPERDAISVNRRAVMRLRAVFGEAEARGFVACAVAHERYHRACPGGSEAEAHAYAQAACRVDPRRFEAALRALR